MEILELLKTKFAGVRSDVLAQLASSMSMFATTDDEKESAVEKLTQAQVEAFGKDYRKAVDAEVSSGTKTFEENLRKKYDLVEKQEQTKKNPPKEEAEDDPIKKMLEETKKKHDDEIKELNEKIAELTSKGVREARRAKFDEVIGSCKDDNVKSIYEGQFEFLQGVDDESFSKHMETLKGSVDKTNQLFAERSLPQKPSYNTQTDLTKVSDGMKAYVEKMNGKTEK